MDKQKTSVKTPSEHVNHHHPTITTNSNNNNNNNDNDNDQRQRPATNDQRPTTNDQRPTTNDQHTTHNTQHTTHNHSSMDFIWSNSVTFLPGRLVILYWYRAAYALEVWEVVFAYNEEDLRKLVTVALVNSPQVGAPRFLESWNGEKVKPKGL